MMTPDEIRASADTSVPVMFAPGDATEVQTSPNGGAAMRMGWAAVMGGVVAALVL